MKKQTITFILLATALFIFAGCGEDTTANGALKLPNRIKSITPPSSGKPADISQELSDALFYTMDEKRLAYDVYNELYSQYGARGFANIAKSEHLHIEAVQHLFKKYFSNDNNSSFNYINTPIEDMPAGTYDIPSIQNLYNSLILRGLDSEIAALKVGCMVEVTSVDSLTKYIRIADRAGGSASDIATVFRFLLDGDGGIHYYGSHHHYWVFDQELRNQGELEGCCSLGTIMDKNYCHREYPKPSKPSTIKRRRKR
ncbi:MAG: DUF2202 domain-containing protein [Sulfurovum sp.]|nr:DUF2202 domain-containing protein [Sulfurovum sp.]